MPQVAICPGPVSEPGGLISCGYFPGRLVGPVKAWATALTGPTSLPGKYPQLINPPGSETGPGQIATWGKSTVCSVDAFGYKFEWTTNSSKHIPFDWTGP